MNASTSPCLPSADAAFGPVVSGECRSGFDFTIVFEQSIFVILPALMLLFAAPVRLAYLNKAPVKVEATKARHVKVSVAAALAIVQIVLVVLWATRRGSARLNSVSLAAACVSSASSVMSCVLSYIEHAKSPRPSSLLNAFLLVSLLLDSALLRTLWLAHNISLAIQGVFSAAFALRTILLFLEARSKAGSLVPDGRAYAPEETASLYARAVLAWVGPLLRTGFQRLLRPADMFALDEEMGSAKLNGRFWIHWNKSVASKHQKQRLLRCCISTLARPILKIIPPRLLLLAFTICQPLILSRFLEFLRDLSQPANVGYGLIGAYGVVYLGIAVSQALYWHCNARCVAMLRGTLVSAVYAKVTDISVSVGKDGAALTLMSSDVDVIVRAAREIHEFWANILQIAIGTWLLSRHIGYAAAGPVIVAAIALLATVLISPRAKKYQVGWLSKTQKRVGITSAMIGHIKSIKMTGLSETLSSTLSALRLAEVTASRPFRIVGSITSSVAQIPSFLSPVVALAMYQGVELSTGQTLDATKMFTALALITLLSQPLFWMFEVVLNLSAASGAFDRIQKFLLEDTKKDTRNILPSAPDDDGPVMEGIQLHSIMCESSGSFAIKVIHANMAWSEDRIVLSNISFTIDQGSMAMLLGPVASGKSTLLKSLLGEVPHVDGQVSIASEKISWCEQSPWIVNQTVRDNIIGFASFDEALYNKVVDCCALSEDFKQLPQGDMTLVGSKGLSLSGGQKQRVALARAAYSKPEIAIFDDIFSGLDNQTAAHIFRNLFAENGLLRSSGATIIMATQSTNFMSQADLLITLTESGVIGETGSYSQLSKPGGYVQKLLKNRSQGLMPSSDAEITPEHPSQSERRQYKEKPKAVTDDNRRQLGDSTVYRYYFGSIGAVSAGALMALEIIWAIFQSFPTVWLNFWTEANERSGKNHTGYYLGVYAALQVLGVLWFALLIWFVLVNIAAKVGITLHGRLLSAVLSAPLALFTTVDLGSITTRFSQDIGILDNQLPLALVVTLASFFTVFAKAALLAFSSYYVAISFPFLGALYFYLQRGYLRTSRQLRFLDLEQKAPVYSQFLETLSGLATIRAFGWGGAAIEKNHELVDRSQKPFYLLIMVQRWLVLVLDLTTTVLALLVVGFAVHLRGSVSVGLTGVSLVQLISMSETLNTLIQFWTSIETSIGAVARIKQFTEETCDENASEETREPPSAWPDSGHIVVSNLTASYDETETIKALDDINLVIQPGETICICGRTGSGKSSILLCLMRLLDSSSGSIIVDGENLSTLPQDTIRGRFIAVSQDQFVLPGTVRQNIDPFDRATTHAIINALEAVGIWQAIEARGGLEAEFSEDMLSHGQQQLFFLSRAVLRKDAGRILLLDEATSSVDSETEEAVRKVIETEFKEHTVISIAHRLDSVMRYDRVVVLDKGRVAEVGQPQQLLEVGGKFRDLWEASH